LVTTRLKPGFITSNLLTAEDQICGQVLSNFAKTNFVLVANEKNEQLDFAAC